MQVTYVTILKIRDKLPFLIPTKTLHLEVSAILRLKDAKMFILFLFESAKKRYFHSKVNVD
jgi:hypothetical protein